MDYSRLGIKNKSLSEVKGEPSGHEGIIPEKDFNLGNIDYPNLGDIALCALYEVYQNV
jgi:hypothetical protein